MERRSFIKKIAISTSSTLALPYILPSGRLFAATGNRIVDHVVICLYAGGVRNLETIHKAEGNLMPNILEGNEKVDQKIIGGMSTLPKPFSTKLQSYGTLFKEFRYATGNTLHFNAHTSLLTGRYSLNDINLKQRPENPTIFEYYRKHNSLSNSAMNAWWVSNSLGPYPSLNYSNYTSYGFLYGANYFQPNSVLSQTTHLVPKSSNSLFNTEIKHAHKIKATFDNNFAKSYTNYDSELINKGKDVALHRQLLEELYSEALNGQYENPWSVSDSMSNDMYNVFFAEKLIVRFKPELLVVSMQDMDIGHIDFTKYCDNIRKADFAVAHLWQTIQSTPGMSNNTMLIVLPEHGRNLKPNTMIDAYGKYALDHTNDDTSREIFCLVAGPKGKITQNQVISNVFGQTIDIIPTVAKALGFLNEIPSQMLEGKVLESVFV